MTTPAELAEQILHKELDVEGMRIVSALRNVRDELKALRALEEEAKNELKAWLGLASTATIDGAPVAKVDTVFRESFDLAKAKADPVYAEMMRACTTASSYTTVRLV